MASKKPPKRGGFGWPGLIGLAVTIVLLWLVLRGVDLAEVGRHLRDVRVLPFIVAIIVATAAFPIRTVRWWYLLRVDGQALSFLPLWHATAIGFMANNVLPARSGEVARAYAARRLTGVPFTTAVGTLVIERILDGLTLVTLLAIAAAAGGFSSDTQIGDVPLATIMTGASVLFAAILGAAMVAVWFPNFSLGITRATARAVLPHRWADKITAVAKNLLDGLEVLRSGRRFVTVALWSFAVWGVNGLSFLACFYAFNLQVPVSAAFVLQSIIAFGVAIPSSPGFFGPFEFATRITLAAYGIGATAAVSYAVGYHIGTFLPITLLGLWSLSRAHLHLTDLRGDTEPPANDGEPVMQP